MARLTVSYSIEFIPGLPRPLVLSEVIDDVVELSAFSSRHTVRKAAGTPDRVDVIVPVDDLQSALDSAAQIADELTRIGQSLLGLGFIVEERSIRVEGLADNWLPDTFDGAGTRRHATTHLDAAAPLPSGLDDPSGDIPDEDLHLDALHDLPAADVPHDPDATAAEPVDPFGSDEGSYGDDPFAVDFRLSDRFAEDRPVDDTVADAPLHSGPERAARFQRGDAADHSDALARHTAGHSDALARHTAGHPDTLARHRSEAAGSRRRDLARHAHGTSRAERGQAFGLLAVASVAVVVPWTLAVSTGAIVGLAVAALALVAGVLSRWPRMRDPASRAVLTTALTLAIVLAFASAYAICARRGDLHGAGSGPPTVGQSLSATVSLGAAGDLTLGPEARSVAYLERLFVLLALVGVGALVVRTSTTRSSDRDG